MAKVKIASACVNFISDIVILLLPQKIIWGLHMSFSKKIGVAALFAAGLLGVHACNSSKALLTYSSASICAGIWIHSTVKFATSDDIMWNAADMGMWSIAEMTAGFFVLCLPSLRNMFTDSPWIQKVFSSIRSSTAASKAASSGNSFPTIEANRRQPRTANDILYSGWDKTGVAPLTSISVKSVQTEGTAPTGNSRYA
ncbi:hypothetical protein GQ44DRAFT_724771 [Phaeosphaeriaceae sp. PMI808]|nr:hypothetical protein GQ44DRAFT_724771 [Phaeosphaeriaceae sp. PMI808]